MSTLRSSLVRSSHLRSVLVWVATVAVEAFVARQALADQASLDLDYRAAETCPSAQEFLADVRFRTGLASQGMGRDARQFVVSVGRNADRQFSGSLSIVSPDGSTSAPREVSDASCLEVVRTLALVTALAIDPQASTGPSTIGADHSRPVEVSPQASDSLPGVPPGTPPFISRTRATPALPQGAEQAQPSRSRHAGEGLPRVNWHWSGGVQGIALFQVAPVPALGGGLFAQLHPDGRWIIWPDFRVTAAYARTTSEWVAGPPASAGAESRWLLARVEACPGRIGTANGELILRFCGFLDAGAFTNSGVDLANSRTTTKEWVAVGPAMRLTLALGSRLFVDFEPGLVIPITRWRFTYKDSSTGPDQGLDRIRSVGESLSLSLGYGLR